MNNYSEEFSRKNGPACPECGVAMRYCECIGALRLKIGDMIVDEIGKFIVINTLKHLTDDNGEYNHDYCVINGEAYEYSRIDKIAKIEFYKGERKTFY